MPLPQGDHALRAACFALDIAAAAASCPVDPDDESAGFVAVRVGLHSGPVIGTVVGNARNRPKYTLLGDTVRAPGGRAAFVRLGSELAFCRRCQVNQAARMEAASERNRVTATLATQRLLAGAPGIRAVPRGTLAIKGKGLVECYFLEVAADSAE